MKNLKTKLLFGITLLMLSATTVSAALYWTSGYEFSKKGTSYSKEVTAGKDYTTFLLINYKYTDPEMTFTVTSSKGNLGILPVSKDCTVPSGTDKSGTKCNVKFTRTTPDKVNTKITWKQKTDGNLNGELSMPSE